MTATMHDQESSPLRRGRAELARPRRKAAWKTRPWAFLYILPAALVYVGFSIWPALNTVYYSLLKWDGLNPASWVGVENYLKVFKDPFLYGSILHSLVLVIFFCLVPIVMGLLFTGLLTGGGIKGMTFFRVVYFLPQVVPLVAVGVTWRWIYAQDGILNSWLRILNLDFLARPWLAQTSTALVAVGIIGAWCMTGLCMMLFISGVQKIDTSLYEAATMDGAGAYRRFTAITLPGLRGEISIAAVITTIAALASFDLIYVTTNGGPENSTTVPGLLVYRLAFSYDRIGDAAALAVILTLIILVFVGVIRRITREEK